MQKKVSARTPKILGLYTNKIGPLLKMFVDLPLNKFSKHPKF